MADSQYPLSDKLSDNAEARDAINEFVAWLNGTKRMSIGEWAKFDGFRDEMFTPARATSDSLVMEFLGIDPVALEKEPRAMLEQYSRIEELRD